MDYGWLSHAILWLIGAMALVTTIGAMTALLSLGRQAYRKD